MKKQNAKKNVITWKTVLNPASLPSRARVSIGCLPGGKSVIYKKSRCQLRKFVIPLNAKFTICSKPAFAYELLSRPRRSGYGQSWQLIFLIIYLYLTRISSFMFILGILCTPYNNIQFPICWARTSYLENLTYLQQHT